MKVHIGGVPTNYRFHIKVLVVLYIVVSSLYMGFFGLYAKKPRVSSRIHPSPENDYDRNTIRLNVHKYEEEMAKTPDSERTRPRPTTRHTEVLIDRATQKSKPNYMCNYDQLNVDDTNETLLNSCQFDRLSLDTLDEDVFKLNKLSIPLLKNYRNPCWYEELPSDMSGMYDMYKSPFPDQAQQSYDVMRPVLESRMKAGHRWRLRCLPLVYMIGVAKCGTTDLFQLLKKHPHFIKGATKEPIFWNFGKYKMAHASMADYLDLYDEAAETIRKKTEIRKIKGREVVYHPVVTADASVSYLFRFEGENLPENRHSSLGPIRYTPHFIKHITPNAKILLIVRNPTERLYSEYLFFNARRNTSVEEFDTAVRQGISLMTSCLKQYHVRRCVYDPKYIDHKETWVRLVGGMYAPFIKDWMSVFPHMRVIRTEEYHHNRAEIFKDVLEYIGLDIVIPKWANITSRITNQGRSDRKPMLDATKQVLDEFYRPFNRELADLMNDKGYLFLDGES